MARPQYSNAERKFLIELARINGMSDIQIFRRAITGVVGTDNRKRIIIQWGELMGQEASEALRIAQQGGLIVKRRLPKAEELVK